MRILKVRQGEPAWHEARRSRLCASEAAAMLGLSPHMTRSRLLELKKTGLDPITEDKEWLFRRGHAAEALGRKDAEELLAEELYPCTAVSDDDRLLASLDGLTMCGDTVFECKLWNAALASAIDVNELPPAYWPQAEHQMLVTGAERVLFMCRALDSDARVWMEYRSVSERRAQLLAGWKQFELDLATFEPTPVATQAVAVAIPSLPYLSIRLSGDVIESNLDPFRVAVLARIDAIKTDLVDDQDFADATATVTFLEDAEKKLEVVKDQALDSTAPIRDVFKVMDELREAMRAKRLALSKKVEAEKANRRQEIVRDAADAYAQHVRMLQTRVAVLFTAPAADFGGSIKGKRSLAAMKDAVSTTLANAKIAANALADQIETRKQEFERIVPEHERHYFADLTALLIGVGDGFESIVATRLNAARAAAAKVLASMQTNEAPAKREVPPHLKQWADMRGEVPLVPPSSPRWTFDVIDENAIPREYLKPNEPMIAEAISDGVIVSGVKARLLEQARAA